MSTHRRPPATTSPHPPATDATTEALDATQAEYARMRLANLEQARTHLIQAYQSKLAEITTARTSLQTALNTTPAPTSLTPDAPPRPSLPPLSPEAPVYHASARRTHLTSVLGWLASTIAVTWSVTTPQYVFSVLPHVPLYPILLTIGLGLLMALITQWNDRATSRRAASAVGMLSALLVGAPFLATWIVCSWMAWPTWPAALAGLLGPSLLLLHAYHPTRLGTRHLDTAMIRFDDGPWAKLITGLTSLFFGYGSIILGVFLTSAVTRQPFGPLVVTHRAILVLIGTALSGGIFYGLHRSVE